MSAQKFQNDDGNGVTLDDKPEDSIDEHLYEDSVFETSKKIKKDNEPHQADAGIKRAVVQQKTGSPIPIEERKHKSATNLHKQTQMMRDNVSKSREIHRRLMDKRNRWKPSELELAILKHNYDKNIYPTKEEKETIIKSLEDKFKSKIDIN